MKAEGELRDSGPVERSWKTLVSVPMKRVPGILAIPAVDPLLNDLDSEVMRPPDLTYVTSHTVFVSTWASLEGGGGYRTCDIAKHHGESAEEIVFPDSGVVLERLLEVCLEREGDLAHRQHRPWVAEGVIRGLVPDSSHDVGGRKIVDVFHEVSQERLALGEVLVEVQHVGFGVVAGEVPGDVHTGAIRSA